MAKPTSKPQLSMEAAYYADDLGGIPEQHWCRRFFEHIFLKFKDSEFAGMYQVGGRYPVSPRMLMCICILQYMFGLSDRRAVEESIASRHWRFAPPPCPESAARYLGPFEILSAGGCGAPFREDV